MRLGKQRLFIILNMLLIIGGIATGLYTHVTANIYFTRDILVVSPIISNNRYHFSTQDIADMQRVRPDCRIAVESLGKEMVTCDYQQAYTAMYYCDAGYFDMHFIRFAEGGSWQAADEKAKNIILSEALAWKLFGGRDVIGQIAEVNGAAYRVVGVAQQERADGYAAWLPFYAHETGQPVTTLYIQPKSYNKLNAYLDAQAMLQYIYRNPMDYSIVDLNNYVESMRTRYKFLLYGVWIYIFIQLVTVAVHAVRPFTRDKQSLMRAALLWGSVALTAYLLTDINQINLWLPRLGGENISLFRRLTNIGTLQPDAYLSYGLKRLSQLNGYENIALIVGAVGFINLMFCWPSMAVVQMKETR